MSETRTSRLTITAAAPDPALLDLPWDLPLEDWPEELLAALPRGISRHIVRFVRMSGAVFAVKEIGTALATNEYGLLRMLRRMGLPAVEPIGVISNRRTTDGQPLDSALITRHLQYSLPYRALFAQSLRDDTATRLVDALTVLMVRLHLAGFYWGDVSLSNTLFRRDAGAFAAYLVDAETGDLHDTLSRGQRLYDVELACMNIAGELMDLQAGGYLDEDFDPMSLTGILAERYTTLWAELTDPESFERGERWRVDARIRRLNELGFDVGELAISTDIDGTSVIIEPKVVDAGHHSRRLLRLTGLDVEENQARRLLNDMDTYIAAINEQGGDEELLAHRWLARCFEPVIHAIPRDLRGKLEPAELYHEVLEHRWYLSERAAVDVGLDDATTSYASTVLPVRLNESSIVGVDTLQMPVVVDDD